jgi:hypothetical protein
VTEPVHELFLLSSLEEYKRLKGDHQPVNEYGLVPDLLLTPSAFTTSIVSPVSSDLPK